MSKTVDFDRAYEAQGGNPDDCGFIRQDGIIYAWSESNFRYEPAWWLNPELELTPLVSNLRRDHSPTDEPWVMISEHDFE